MTKRTSPSSQGQGDQDPWAAFGYLVAGVAFYGFIGWLLGRWLHADYLVPVGIVVGVLFGMYMVFARYRFRGDDPSRSTSTPAPIDSDRPNDPQADREDRGDTQ